MGDLFLLSEHDEVLDDDDEVLDSAPAGLPPPRPREESLAGFEITFPRRMSWVMKAVNLLPYPIYFWLIAQSRRLAGAKSL